MVNEDDQLTVLLNIESDEKGLMLQQCLSLIFAGFVTVSERMLEDHLVDGKYYEPNENSGRKVWEFQQLMPTQKEILEFWTG